MMTRKQYMEEYSKHTGNKTAQMELHLSYYSQFVTEGLCSYIKRTIGEHRILNSKHPYFSDIPLREWDSLMVRHYVSAKLLKDTGEGGSISTYVCIAKTAADIIRGITISDEE